MGSIFIYITKEKLPAEWSINDLQSKILKQRSAYLLDRIVSKLPKEHRDKFPYLQRLEFYRGYYDDEKTFLLNSEIKLLKAEFDLIIDIIHRRIFLEKVDTDELLYFLSQDSYPTPTKEEIIEELEEIKELIDYAVENEGNIYIDR